VNLIGYFAPFEDKNEEGKEADPPQTKVPGKHIRRPAEDIEGRGEVFVDHWEGNPINLTLGDDRLPYGLWKALEHMRRGETSRIMIKPKYGYNCSRNRDKVLIPKEW